MAVRRATKRLKHLASSLYIQLFCDVTHRHCVSDYRPLQSSNTH